MARDLERHAFGGPCKHLLEGRADDPNQVAIVLATQIRLDRTAVLVRRLYNHLTSPDLILSVSCSHLHNQRPVIVDVFRQAGVTLASRFPFDATTEHRSRPHSPRLNDARSSVLVQFTITRGECGETLGEDETSIDGTTELGLDRRCTLRDIRRIRGRLHVDADAEDNVTGGALRENPGELAAADVHVVRPFYVRGETGRRRDAIGHRNTGGNRHQSCRCGRGSQYHRHVDACARRRRPAPPEAPTARRLPIGEHDESFVRHLVRQTSPAMSFVEPTSEYQRMRCAKMPSRSRAIAMGVSELLRKCMGSGVI